MSIEAPPLERKLVAILAADVEGYSRMMHVDEEATLETLSAHRFVVDGLIEAAGGSITSTAGDSVLAEFASVVEAAICAVEIQRSLTSANAALPPEREMHFRIGINVGDVMVKDGGIFGDGVNVAARVEAIAPPGGICVTRGVRDHLRDRLPYAFEDHGDHVVKNIARPVHVFRLLYDEAATTAAAEGGDEIAPDAPQAQPEIGSEPDEAELLFWKSVESGGTVEEFRAYLERYPEGLFAPIASARVAAPVSTEAAAPASPVEQGIELAFWNSIQESNDRSLVEAYLHKYPDGEFKVIAEARLREMGNVA